MSDDESAAGYRLVPHSSRSEAEASRPRPCDESAFVARFEELMRGCLNSELNRFDLEMEEKGGSLNKTCSKLFEYAATDDVAALVYESYTILYPLPFNIQKNHSFTKYSHSIFLKQDQHTDPKPNPVPSIGEN